MEEINLFFQQQISSPKIQRTTVWYLVFTNDSQALSWIREVFLSAFCYFPKETKNSCALSRFQECAPKIFREIAWLRFFFFISNLKNGKEKNICPKMQIILFFQKKVFVNCFILRISIVLLWKKLAWKRWLHKYNITNSGVFYYLL